MYERGGGGAEEKDPFGEERARMCAMPVAANYAQLTKSDKGELDGAKRPIKFSLGLFDLVLESTQGLDRDQSPGMEVEG